MDDEQSLEIENSVLDRCIHHGGVVHIFVDRKSTYVSVAVSCVNYKGREEEEEEEEEEGESWEVGGVVFVVSSGLHVGAWQSTVVRVSHICATEIKHRF